MSILLFLGVISLFPTTARAGLFSDFIKFFTGDNTSASESSSVSVASISTPLLGSNSDFQGVGVGGFVDDNDSPLSITQDNAFIASRNPVGSLPDSRQDTIVVYKVQFGDTPSGIAANFGISLNTLLWANNIRNPNLIKIGDELIILPVSGVYYKIVKGDTINSIAKKFKGDAVEIVNFNGLVIDESLQAGATIIIPDGEFSLPPSSTNVAAANRFANLPSVPDYYLRPIAGGRKSRGIHGYNGIDLANHCGFPIYASASGSVIIARYSGWNGGYGNYLVISHPNGTQTLYAHLSSILTSVGQYVTQGSQIASIGSTGNSTGCHVHFEVRGARNPF